MWHRSLVELLHRAKRSEPGDLPHHLNASLAPTRVGMTIYLIDHEQRRLHPLPAPHAPARPIDVERTGAGRAFMTTATVPAGEPGCYWVPMIDGSERLGVVHCNLPPAHDAGFLAECETFVGLLGHLVTTKLPYGDALHRTRRTQAMSPAGELLLSMLPPLTFHCSRVVVSAILEPAYDVGGDAFDYALDQTTARFLVLDAMGRGLNAALTSATALAAIRASRRRGDDLATVAKAGHDAIRDHFSDLRFATGILSELELNSGVLRYVNAGHPPPVLLRAGKAVKELTAGGRVPLGLSTMPTRASPPSSCGQATGCCSTPTAWWRRATQTARFSALTVWSTWCRKIPTPHCPCRRCCGACLTASSNTRTGPPPTMPP